MATIKAIEARSVHQIQSGQVIVDLCSVVKELVENSLDAGASTVEVRFKNNGLDSIEVQDNGNGISSANYETVALKHYTSKISSYEDLSTLRTFGFRGEALSSLCALSNFHFVTAQADEVPKGKRLDFESSGKLKSTTMVASQKGTTASVEGLFEQLPVRRKELVKNIKREYGKVVGLLHAYACISTGVKFIVKNAMPKGKIATVFATNGNATTKENIANVYGAKTLLALVPLDLDLEFQPSGMQKNVDDTVLSKVSVRGHISRPVYGEGRQTPDRQMFFVNARPCGLPQIAKAINEVYKSFNASQSPFIFADFRMNTNAYDVNVSPDKRTILLHDSATMLEKLKTCLTELFEQQEQTMPQSLLRNSKLPAFKQLTVPREGSVDSTGSPPSDASEATPSRRPPTRKSNSHAGRDEIEDESEPSRLLHDFFRHQTTTREETTSNRLKPNTGKTQRAKEIRARAIADKLKAAQGDDEHDDADEVASLASSSHEDLEGTVESIPVRDFNKRMAEQRQKPKHQQPKHQQSEQQQPEQQQPEQQKPEQQKPEQQKPERLKPSTETSEEAAIPSMSPAKQSDQWNVVQNAFDRMRPKRTAVETATITMGDKTVTTIVGSQRPNKVQIQESDSASKRIRRLKTTPKVSSPAQQFSQSLRSFAAPGTQGDDGPHPREPSVSESENEEVGIKPCRTSEDSESEIEGHLQPNEHNLRLAGTVMERNTGLEVMDGDDADGDYVDEAEKKAEEEARVADLIRAAEESSVHPSKDNIKRANKVLKSGLSKDSTTTLLTRLDVSIAKVEDHIKWVQRIFRALQPSAKASEDESTPPESEEERLALTVSKHDFASMHIVGQFNLGFILAVRPPATSPGGSTNATKSDELFIIDQHASDEKFNFERLQADTVVNNQRLVRPLVLDLTAVEEEIVIENVLALEKNGFIVEVDTSGDQPIGQRCKLLSLPLSKEVVFNTRDLEELIHLLAESPTVGLTSMVPRPSKVRKMFAMRACRSSIMIGKTLTGKQMSTVIRNMGMIDKPWNCPHGRPTMRHLMSLNAFDVWDEGEKSGVHDSRNRTDAEVWRQYGQ
jgi:DNA mismatch repair protein PMS2